MKLEKKDARAQHDCTKSQPICLADVNTMQALLLDRIAGRESLSTGKIFFTIQDIIDLDWGD